MKDRISFYLAEGLTASDVASIVGCSAGYISQLLKDEDFKAAVEKKLMDRTSTADQNLLHKYAALEHKLVKTIGTRLEEAELPNLTRALDAIVRAQDAAVKRVNPHLAQPTQNVQIVQIALPAHALAQPAITLNEQSEVIAIGNKPLSPMSSEGVRNLFQHIQEGMNNVSQNAIPQAISMPSATEATAGQGG